MIRSFDQLSFITRFPHAQRLHSNFDWEYAIGDYRIRYDEDMDEVQIENSSNGYCVDGLTSRKAIPILYLLGLDDPSI